MLAILGVVSIGLLLSALIESDDGSSVSTGGGSAAPDTDTFTDGDDNVADQLFRSDIEANLLDLVTEGEVSQQEADDLLANVNFVTGAQNVDTGAGDDDIALGAGDDVISAGDGEDYVFGGPGDDEIDLGLGNDVSGVDPRVVSDEDIFVSFPEPSIPDGVAEEDAEAFIEGGDDRIFGGGGDDMISDSFGSNFVHGQQGDDFIVTVDDASDGVTPDRVKGGFGFDTLIVDQGDSVETGRGFDTVTVDLFAGVEDGYQVVTIDDFEKGKDTLELEGDVVLLRGATPEGPDDVVEAPITVAPLADGSGSVVSVNGIPVVRVIGAADLTAADVVIST